MRPGFRERLQDPYGEIAKDAADLQELAEEGEDVAESLEKLSNVFDWAIDKAIKARGSHRVAQEDIFGLQVKKQEVMTELKADIRALDEEQSAESKEAEPDSYLVKQKNGIFVRVEKDGTEKRITKGEILTDGEWGIKCHFDETVSRNLRKRYLIEEAKRKLQDYLDEQIIIDELSSEHTHYLKKKAYAGVFKDKKSGKYERLRGLVAERLVKNFFKKLYYDFGLSVQIVEADIFQDVEQKVDFIMHRLLHYRGVGVEEAKKGDVGVQFTVNDAKENLNLKRTQIRKAKERIQHGEDKYVQDIMLVTIPMQEATDIYRKWDSGGRMPGGPDKTWNWEFKKKIFKGVLEGVLSPDEIDEEWKKIRQGSTRKGELKLPETVDVRSAKKKAA